jgi:SAM-dependent methyltransferase
VEREPLVEVVAWCRAAMRSGATRFELDVPDPDTSGGAWPGATDAEGVPRRTWRSWVDLGDELGCAVATPRPLPGGRVRIAYRRLGGEAPWHAAGATAAEARYAGDFLAVQKLEEPGFLVPLLDALERTRPPDGGRVLVLGCGRGDEIAALSALEPPPRALDVVGVDHAEAPLVAARIRFPRASFRLHDLADLPADMGRFDLVVAIAVLQSPSVDDRALLHRLVQTHLTPTGALLLGLPASRFRDGEIVWGARTRNYAERDLSLVVKDLAAYRRYLHQHGFRTHVGGRYDLLLSATRTPRDGRPSPSSTTSP